MKYTTRSFNRRFGEEGTFAKGQAPSATPWQVIFWTIFVSGVGMILSAALLALGLCWKVSSVTVEGSDFYDTEAILEVVNIKEGDLVLGFDRARLERILKEECPIVSSVSIKRGLDGSVTLQIKEEPRLYYTCHHVNDYLIAGDDMKVLHVSSTDMLYRDYGAMYLGLPEEASLQVGKKVSYEFLPYEPVDKPEEAFTYEVVTQSAGEEYAYVFSLVEALENSPFYATMDGVDASDRYDLYFVFNRCIMVRLGSMDDLDRKLDQALYIVTNELSSGDIPAVIDVSDLSKSTLRQNPQLLMPDWCKIE